MKKSTIFQMYLIDNLIWVLVIAFFIVNTIFTPNFATSGNMINVLYHSSIMSLLVMAQGLVLINGKLDLSLESILGFAPGIAMLLSLNVYPDLIGPVSGLILTLIIGGLIGLFNGVCIGRLNINPLLQTLASMIMFRGILLFAIPSSIFPLDPIFRFPGSARIADVVPVAIPLILVIFLAFHLFLQYTPLGRHFVSAGGNPRASFVSGIDVQKMTIYAYVLAGVLAAVGGILAAGRQGSVDNGMGEGMVLLSFAGALMGGASLQGGEGTPLGMLGGALLLGMFDNALNLQGVGPSLIYALKGGLIFIALLLDRTRVKWRGHLLHKEQMEKLAQEEKITPTETG